MHFNAGIVRQWDEIIAFSNNCLGAEEEETSVDLTCYPMTRPIISKPGTQKWPKTKKDHFQPSLESIVQSDHGTGIQKG